MPDDDAPAKGKMGPAAYDTSIKTIKEATERSDLDTLSDEAPRPLPEGEPTRPPRRAPGHESPTDAF